MNPRTHGSGCGTDGRAVASNSGDPRFESSHRQNIIMHKVTVSVENTNNRPGMAHILEPSSTDNILSSSNKQIASIHESQAFAGETVSLSIL